MFILSLLSLHSHQTLAKCYIINIVVHINYFVLNKFDTDIKCDCYRI